MIDAIATADHDAQQRHLALTDCVDQTRRAASAALAAACGESDDVRVSVLVDARRHLLAVLLKLQGLALAATFSRGVSVEGSPAQLCRAGCCRLSPNLSTRHNLGVTHESPQPVEGQTARRARCH